MYCSKCGNRIPPNAKYCPVCGNRQMMGIVPDKNICSDSEQNQESNIQKARRRGRRIGNLLVSIAALLILFAGNEKVPDHIASTAVSADAACFTVQNQKEMVICDEKGTVYTLDIPRKLLYSADRQQMAYIDRDGELYRMDHMEPVFVDDHVTDAKLSFYGDTIVYVRNTADQGETLGIYDQKTKDLERLDTADCTQFAVSTDGRTVAFVEAQKGGALSLWTYKGTSVTIAGNVTELLAVPDGGEQVLYQTMEHQLFLHDGKEEKDLSSAEGNVCFLSNEAQTEFLYTEGGRAWYYSMDWKEPVRLNGVKGDIQTVCYLEGAAYQQDHGLILGRKTLKQMIFATQESDGSSKLYHLDWKGERAETVLNRADQFQITGNGQSLLCLSEQKLYRINDPENPSERICLSNDQKVSQFAADPKFQKVWFSTPDGELYYVKKEECIRLSANLKQLYGRLGDGVLFLEGQDLYFAKGEEKSLVRTAVEEVSIQEQNYAVVDLDGEWYYLKDLEDAVYLMGSR